MLPQSPDNVCIVLNGPQPCFLSAWMMAVVSRISTVLVTMQWKVDDLGWRGNLGFITPAQDALLSDWSLMGQPHLSSSLIGQDHWGVSSAGSWLARLGARLVAGTHQTSWGCEDKRGWAQIWAGITQWVLVSSEYEPIILLHKNIVVVSWDTPRLGRWQCPERWAELV